MQFHSARPRGPWFGWGISLLVHACVLAWLVHAVVPATPPVAPAEAMHFVLVPPKPREVAPAVVDAAPAASVALPAPAAARPARMERSRPLALAPQVPAIKPVPAETAPEKPAAVAEDAPAAADSIRPAGIEPAQEPGAGDAKLDMPAAIKTARLVDRHRKDSLVAFPKPEAPLKRDDRLERAINRAHRDLDCKKAYSGLGLLAVIPLAKDTLTGTGCRW